MLSFLFGEDEEAPVPVPVAETQAKQAADTKPNDDAETQEEDFPAFTHSVFVCGFASGKSKLNGEYKMTGKWVGGRPVYSNADKQAGMSIWYSDGWCIGPRKHLGTPIAMAHNEYKGNRVWITNKPWKVQVGGAIKDEENVKLVPLMSACVIGADGSNKALNGVYELQMDLIKLPKSVRDKFQDRPVFKKKGGEGGPHCIWCCDQGWCIGLESDVGSKMCYAASDDSSAVPWLVKSSWKMVRNGGGEGGTEGRPYWTESSNLQVVSSAEAYLSGCSVSNGAWNGLYVMREDWVALPFFSRQTFRGRPVFQHKEGKQQCIWFSELGWCVGLERDIGTTRCGIYNKCDAAVPWLCTQPWQVLQNKAFKPSDSLKIAPVCTEETTKARQKRLQRAAAKKSKTETAIKGAGESSAGTDSGDVARLEIKVGGLAGRLKIEEDKAKDLCQSFVSASEAVGLSKESSEEKLKACDAVARMETAQREAALVNMPPLLKKLVEKLREIQTLNSDKAKALAELEQARKEAKERGPKTTPVAATSSPTEDVARGALDFDSTADDEGKLPDLPEPMVKGLSEELQKQIAEAERKLEEGPDIIDSLNPLPVLRDIPLLGSLVEVFAPAPREEPLHAFEPGRFE
mmetsp:Transcript_15691/g.28165  ORF Transcript_15691/g.28165 Transcript_15691/m.28165 type:complete len:630 (-) Transcript_15691:240-2129(-)